LVVNRRSLPPHVAGGVVGQLGWSFTLGGIQLAESDYVAAATEVDVTDSGIKWTEAAVGYILWFPWSLPDSRSQRHWILLCIQRAHALAVWCQRLPLLLLSPPVDCRHHSVLGEGAPVCAVVLASGFGPELLTLGKWQWWLLRWRCLTANLFGAGSGSYG
jgi:hypothetical protein